MAASTFATKIACATTSSTEIQQYLEENPGNIGLYFLDLHLDFEMDGISLAKEIRKRDSRGFIVFITSDVKSYKLAFKHKIEAMDCIIKGELDIKERIGECLDNAIERLVAKATPAMDNFVFKTAQDIDNFGGKHRLAKDSIISIDRNKILCFLTEPENKRLVKIYTTEGERLSADNLKNIETKLDNKRFYRCQNNLIVNLDKCVAVDTTQNMLVLADGLKIDIPSRRVKALNERIVAHQNKNS